MKAVVLGRSNIVGKPMALLLMQKGPGATPRSPSATRRPGTRVGLAREADIAGRRRWASPSTSAATGSSRGRSSSTSASTSGPRQGLRRRRFPEAVAGRRLITPVPGGVGPMTIAMLLRNTLLAARLAHGPGHLRSL